MWIRAVEGGPFYVGGMALGPVTRNIFVEYSQYYIHGGQYDAGNWSFRDFNGLVGVLDADGYPADPGEFAIVVTV